MTNDELIQKIYDEVKNMEKESKSLERTSALFDVMLKLIDISIDNNLNLLVKDK